MISLPNAGELDTCVLTKRPMYSVAYMASAELLIGILKQPILALYSPKFFANDYTTAIGSFF